MFYEELGSNNRAGFLRKIIEFIQKKPEWEKIEKLTTEGYIEVKNQEGQKVELVPNLATAETRDFFSEFQSSEDKIKDYERRVLEKILIQQNKMVAAKIETKQKELPEPVAAATLVVEDLFAYEEKNQLINSYMNQNEGSFDKLFLEVMEREKINQQKHDLLKKELEKYLRGLLGEK